MSNVRVVCRRDVGIWCFGDSVGIFHCSRLTGTWEFNLLHSSSRNLLVCLSTLWLFHERWSFSKTWTWISRKFVSSYTSQRVNFLDKQTSKDILLKTHHERFSFWKNLTPPGFSDDFKLAPTSLSCRTLNRVKFSLSQCYVLWLFLVSKSLMWSEHKFKSRTRNLWVTKHCC